MRNKHDVKIDLNIDTKKSYLFDRHGEVLILPDEHENPKSLYDIRVANIQENLVYIDTSTYVLTPKSMDKVVKARKELAKEFQFKDYELDIYGEDNELEFEYNVKVRKVVKLNINTELACESNHLQILYNMDVSEVPLTVLGKERMSVPDKYFAHWKSVSDVATYDISENIIQLNGVLHPLTPTSMKFILDAKEGLPSRDIWHSQSAQYSNIVKIVDVEQGVISFKELTKDVFNSVHLMFYPESLKKIIDVKCNHLPTLVYSKENCTYHFEGFTGYENLGYACKYPLEPKPLPNDVSTQTDFILDPILKKQEDVVKLCKTTKEVCENTIKACDDFLTNTHQEIDDPLLLGQDTLDINFDD